MDYDNSDDLLAAGKKQFQRCQDAEDENRRVALEDIKFSRMGEQWPDEVETQRRKERRPCLTINKLPAFIRQVVNDARQNKPSIKVHPVDSGADVKTADVINGLIRNIEYTSNADVAYDRCCGARAASECFVPIQYLVLGGFMKRELRAVWGYFSRCCPKELRC